MDPLDLARLQFGVTTVYHFIFVPLTIGLAPLVAGVSRRSRNSLAGNDSPESQRTSINNLSSAPRLPIVREFSMPVRLLLRPVEVYVFYVP